MEEKKEIRKRIFKARKEHDDAWIQEKSHVITETLTKLPEYRNAERIMAYADYNHEVMTRYIIEEAWKAGKEVAVPKVVGKDMIFYRLTDFSQLWCIRIPDACQHVLHIDFPKCRIRKSGMAAFMS